MFSDMWEMPTPFTSEWSRALHMRKSPACDEFDLGNFDGEGIIYQRDQYWNKSATVPTQASVLLFSGKLDPQPPHKYAEYLSDALDCRKKALVTFEYATHDALVSTPFGDTDDTSLHCGMELLVSYVSNNSDLQRLDRSCINEMPAFNLTVPVEYVHSFFSTDEAYGVYNASLSQTEGSA
ncbi:hypothetical protein JG687_00013219 [Phytophthora cactorum]|uniref:Peptidase S33 tripeptidyl aminopeptidase-like C-terminal domain-containing protein n=1 Tax=Phytophthora cactorum TaxID=29920 RepID=A0A8T1U2G3_9STRA|nr:hypothetical protein PC120_g19599 [Phytophthora cactorum]KAG6952112.1 hypothetical protein JG687_00013219 [Phytophthora cactorum]